MRRARIACALLLLAEPAFGAEPAGDDVPADEALGTPDVVRSRIADGPWLPSPWHRAPEAKGDAWDAYGWARLRTNHLSAFPLDQPGTESRQTDWYESRLRVGGAYWFIRDEEKPPGEDGVLGARVEVDALSGIFAGDRTDLGTTLDEDTLRYRLDQRFGLGTATLRQAYVEARLPFGLFRVGRQSFTWGEGMLANGGGGEPDFGDRYYGDLVNRIVFGTKPLALTSLPPLARELTVFVGGDLVHRDENADYELGDRAYQGVIGLRTQTEDLALGVFQSVRTQEDREDPDRGGRRSTVDAFATDVWLRATIARLGRARTFRVEGEAAWIYGETTRPLSDATIDGADVAAFGAIARLRYDDADSRLTVKNELGYASGDNDLNDDTVRDFRFDPDYQVGLILFDQVLHRMSARSTDRVSDPSLLAVPPAGVRYRVTQGSVTNAVYLNPVVRYQPVAPLDLRFGYLYAHAAGDVIDPYSAARVGGFNATYGGRSPGSRQLGHELDAAAYYTYDIVASLAVRVGAEGGLFLPGEAFDGVGGSSMDPVWMGRGKLDVTF